MTIEHPKENTDLSKDTSLSDRIKQVWNQYLTDRAGALESAVDLIKKNFQDATATDHIRELHTIAAWSCYHLKRYAECLDHCNLSRSHPRALECELSLRSYVSNYRDDERLAVLSQAIGDTPAAANAFLIRAISMEKVPYSQLTEVVERFFITRRSEVDHTSILGHILTNAAKVLIYNPSGVNRDGELSQAERWMSQAIYQYERVGAAPDHLAAAYFHLSKTINNTILKTSFLEKSLRSWKLFNQGKDPDSSDFQKQKQVEEELNKLVNTTEDAEDTEKTP
jgi:hypothetical protein